MRPRPDKISSVISCGAFSLRSRRTALACTALFLGIFFPISAAAQVSFERDIEPLLHQRCYMCHGASVQMNGLRLDRKEAALRGGYAGPIIVPGDSAASKIFERVSSEKDGFRMPPAGAPLSAAEITALKTWIDSGAEWPEREPAAEISAEEKQNHWSFRQVRRPEPPEVKNAAWIRNPIDRFILAKLEAEGVAPSPEADRVTLMRRAYLDLTGLPPAPEEVDRFLAAGSLDAYEKIVEDLLDSPHYGERQAIPWLDAARYADSDGYERDPIRPHAWRWRQWVIEAFNDDMPFDQFTKAQLAGDLLPNNTLEDRVATGFLRNGVKNREAGVKIEEKRFEELIDRVSTVGTTWLGLTVGCAQCHDHKYDPISQKEFYEFYALFNNAVERDLQAPLPGEMGPYLRAYPTYRAGREKILAENGIPKMQAEYQRKLIEAMEKPGVNTDWDFQLTEWRAAHDRADWWLRAKPEDLTEIERDELIDWFLSRTGPDVARDAGLLERVKCAREQIGELKKDLPDLTRAYTMIEREEREPTYIALRGDWTAPGLEVQPGTPAVLPKLEAKGKPARLALAEWLVDGRNPLTARVAVNRLWQELFGTGLVRTSGDFGTQGERPSHPELLDWLASEFVEGGWSRKHMLRLIVTSAAYRQASGARPELMERDPENRWIARQNRLRLTAELIRDRALAASGLLHPEIGGKSIRPPQPAGVAELGYARKPWDEDTGPQRYRRGLYIFFQRTTPYPMLINFDAPATLTATVQRERSNTPLQALNLLNDPVFQEAAQALAVRVAQEEKGFGERMERLFRLCLSREPEPIERDRIATFFEKQRDLLKNDPEAQNAIAPFVPPDETSLDMAAWTSVARALLNLDEFITRE